MADDRPDATLDELEGKTWGEPEFGSGLVTRCHALRRKPVRLFTAADLQVMLGQKIGVIHLLPLALSKLEQDPLVEGDYYPGDLLESVLKLDAAIWTAYPEWLARVHAVLERVRPTPTEIRPTVESFDRRCGRTRG